MSYNFDHLPIESENVTDAVARINETIGWRTDALTFAQAAELLTVAMPGDTAQARAAAARAALDGILATIASNTSPSVQAIASAWLSGRAAVLGSQSVRGTLAEVLSPEQQAVLAPLLRVSPLVTESDVSAAKAGYALYQAKDARLTAFETFASGFRAAVNAATSIDELPEVPA